MNVKFIGIDLQNDEEISFEETDQLISYPKNILLLMDTDQKEYEVIAEAISLDIRGNYFDIFSAVEYYSKMRYYEEIKYEWIGNAYKIEIKGNNTLVYNCFDMEKSCLINTNEFLKVLYAWKEKYLQVLGFNRFPNNKVMSHIYGIMLLLYDKLDSNYNLEYDQIRYSICQCADRYGMTVRELRDECKRFFNQRSIWDFYKLCKFIFENKRYSSLKDIDPAFMEIVS